MVLARLCSVATEQPLCNDPLETVKFVQLMKTARSILPIPWFSRGEDFLAFIQGKGGPMDLYPTLKSFLGEDSPLMFIPLTLSQEQSKALSKAFDATANIITIHSEGSAGRARIRIEAVVNFDSRWTPPPPNAGSLPPLGALHYWRLQ